MDLVSALGPPRLCRLAGNDLWVKPYTLEDFAVLLAWLDDVLPGKVDRKMPPKLGSEEEWTALLGNGMAADLLKDGVERFARDADRLEGWLEALSENASEADE